jgi:hypothetical protein
MGETNDEGIYELLLEDMTVAEKSKRLVTGKQKHAFVLRQLKKQLGEDVYERYEPFILQSIDFIIKVSKKQIRLLLNSTQKKCGKWF